MFLKFFLIFFLLHDIWKYEILGLAFPKNILCVDISFRRQEPLTREISFCCQRTDYDSFRDFLRDALWSEILIFL